jgi:hypothetical protein
MSSISIGLLDWARRDRCNRLPSQREHARQSSRKPKGFTRIRQIADTPILVISVLAEPKDPAARFDTAHSRHLEIRRMTSTAPSAASLGASSPFIAPTTASPRLVSVIRKALPTSGSPSTTRTFLRLSAVLLPKGGGRLAIEAARLPPARTLNIGVSLICTTEC